MHVLIDIFDTLPSKSQKKKAQQNKSVMPSKLIIFSIRKIILQILRLVDQLQSLRLPSQGYA